ncbi:MAG TPA: hypothetical protein VF720_14600 [Candidatus Eisenbacteria bacterium]
MRIGRPLRRIGSLVVSLAAFAAFALLLFMPDLALAAGGTEPQPRSNEAGNVLLPELCTVPRCLQIHPSTLIANALPNHGAKYNVTIVGNGGPIASANIQIRLLTPGDTLACWCNDTPGPRPHVFSQSTNVQGQARFVIGGGGCIEYGLAAIPGVLDYAGEVFADGIRLQEFGVVSSDAVDNAGRRATDSPRWNPAGTCGAGITDAVEHTGPLGNNSYDWCSDFNCDSATGAADAVIVTPFLAGAASCPGTSGP